MGVSSRHRFAGPPFWISPSQPLDPQGVSRWRWQWKRQWSLLSLWLSPWKAMGSQVSSYAIRVNELYICQTEWEIHTILQFSYWCLDWDSNTKKNTLKTLEWMSLNKQDLFEKPMYLLNSAVCLESNRAIKTLHEEIECGCKLWIQILCFLTFLSVFLAQFPCTYLLSQIHVITQSRFTKRLLNQVSLLCGQAPLL